MGLTEKIGAVRDLLAQPGAWTRGSGNRVDTFCILTGIGKVVPIDDPDQVEAMRVVRRAIAEVHPHFPSDPIVSIAAWNDEKARTPAEVAEVMDLAVTISKNNG